MMNIGTTIRKVRRQKDMTQEQLAEYLNVSVSAVSQWESDKTTPDISAIPAICHLLGITSDELLGIDIAQKQENIDKLIEEISEISRVGHKREAYTRYKEALKQYPDSYDLMYHVASEYIWLENDSFYNTEMRKAMRDEAVELYEKILDGCLDENIRLCTISDLCGFYARNGEREKAEEMALKLPIMCNSRDFIWAGTHGGNEGIQAEKRLLFSLLEFLSNRMIRNRKNDSGELLYTEDEICRLYEKRIELLRVMFENGDYGFYNDDLQEAYLHMAQYYAKHGDSNKALTNLDLAADCAIAFIEFAKCGNYEHTAIVFKGMRESGKGIWYPENDNSASELLNAMQAEEFNAVRSEAEFAAIQDKLNQYKGNWNTKIN